MKSTQLYLATVVTLGVVGFVIADGAPVTYQFAGGDPASATQVNANFQELANRIAANPSSNVYDYRTYQSADTITSKTFATTGLGACGDQEVRAITRTPSGADTIVNIYRTRTNAGMLCHEKGFEYLATATEFKLQQKINYDVTGTMTPTSTDVFNDPVVRRTATMSLGIPIGSSSVVTNTPTGGGGVTTNGIVETDTVLGLEDVTVPVGSFTGCLKIHTLRTSPTTGAFNRISWFCPGMGEVKRTQNQINTFEYRTWELTATG